MRIYIVSLVAVAWLGGCASVVPEAIRTEAPGNVQIAQVRDRPQQFRDAVVRWGGNIVSTRNEREHTVLEIIGRDLDKEGRPQEEDYNLGRFLVKVQGFLDPAIYKPEREVTVRGRIQAVVEQSIGEYRYSYPVVGADDIYLWKPRLPPEPRYRYYDPFLYDPWYPWGVPYPRPWPYYYYP
ncbi:MAG: Slp family lipoprotein [Sulfuricaulis sp.]|nr:Slp family lipoprotein [Sulfuricaulis sp.]